MWLFLWILFVLSVAGVFVWSLHVSHEQKRAWQVFANKYHLQFIKGGLFQPPAITGQLKNRLLNIYIQQAVDDNHSKKTSTMIEVFLTKIPESLAYISSHGFGDLAEQLQIPEPFTVSDPDWPIMNIIARSPDADAASEWFSSHKTRVRAVNKLVKMSYDTAFLIGDDRAFLVLRTSDPLSDPRILNKLIIELYEIASMLETETTDIAANHHETKAIEATVPAHPETESHDVSYSGSLPPDDESKG